MIGYCSFPFIWSAANFSTKESVQSPLFSYQCVIRCMNLIHGAATPPYLALLFFFCCFIIRIWQPNNSGIWRLVSSLLLPLALSPAHSVPCRRHNVACHAVDVDKIQGCLSQGVHSDNSWRNNSLLRLLFSKLSKDYLDIAVYHVFFGNKAYVLQILHTQIFSHSSSTLASYNSLR